jgi:hypothetical protein
MDKSSERADMNNRMVHFFDEPGERNTTDVITAVVGRAKEEGIEAVVVASVSGRTAVKIAETLKGQGLETKVVCVSGPPSWERDAPQYKFPLIASEEREKLETLRVQIVDQTKEPYKPITLREIWEKKTLVVPYPESNLFWMTLICVGGHGFRTAIEVVFMVVEAGALRAEQRVISAAGTNRGLDSAVVLKACRFDDAVGRYPGKRLKVEEILAMPKKTTWRGYG